MVEKVEPVKVEPSRDLELASKSPAHTLALAIERGIAPEVLSKLLDVQERWEENQAHKEFVAAMTAFKASAPAVLNKGSQVDFETTKGRTHYKYANLGDIVQEITSNLSKHELSASWETTQDDKDRIVVTCHITHVRGHRESVTLRGPADLSGNKNAIQAIGSCVTYLQRYTLLAALGLATQDQDDDGIGAGPRPGVNGKTSEKKELSQDEEIKLYETLHSRLHEIEEKGNMFELRNHWTKHFSEIKQLPSEMQKELTQYKDHIKAGFEAKKEAPDGEK